MSGKPTVISTFCGTGGSSLGYHYAGYEELLAIDFDPHAVQCFKLNFPEVPCWKRDITTVSANEILEFCKMEVGQLDILDGSPPCQGFSTAGKRNVNDSCNRLFESYVSLVKDLQPKVFIMENVSGMAKGSMKGKFIEIMKSLKSLNYRVKAKQMNSMYYGVPQSRVRIIFIGVREDLGLEPVFPQPSNKIITVKEAFKGLEEPQERVCPRGGLIELVKKIKMGECAAKYHQKGNYFGTQRLHWNKASPTIIKTVGPTMNLLVHPFVNAGISIIEAKRLCSFPDNWELPGSYKEAWARLGNAVMPKFMEAIAKTIKDEILEYSQKAVKLEL